MWRASVLSGPDSHRFQPARSLGAPRVAFLRRGRPPAGQPGHGSTVGGRTTLCDRPLDARGLGDLVLAVLRRVRARVLVVQTAQAQWMAVQRRHSRAAAVRKGYGPVLAVRRLSGPRPAGAKVLAARKRHARALRLSARPLACAKTLAGTRARATFGQSPNASLLVAQASHATVLTAPFRYAMPRASLMTFQASATAPESAASGPPLTSGPWSLRVTGLGTPRRPESSFPRAATWALRASKELTFALRQEIWVPRSLHSVLRGARTPMARPTMGLPTAVSLSIGLSRIATSASRMPRGRLPQSQLPRRVSAALEVSVSVSVSVALRTRRLRVRARRRCEPMLPRRIAGASECCLRAGLGRSLPGQRWVLVRG